MHLSGTHQLSAPRDRIFDALTDPAILQKCIPGCEHLEKTAENQYKAALAVGVGPIKGKFSANVSLHDLLRPERYSLSVDGTGQPGFVKGSGKLEFREEGQGTAIAYDGEVNVGGLLASVGQRMIQATASMMIGRFFSALENETRASQK
ncbi:MAG TPA: carbon monoxide dehydrogenase subunit G [Terriglobales bacterium]|nr:carbon monoxide dehydrogenase subunit G [Terriglobales bacterium]